MRIQNNITAMNTHRQYTINNENVARNAEKLSSGYRINRAGDDAAGLAISEKMRSQIRGLNMATKNSQDAISLVQTAEGALQETQNMLQRMNELAVQAATGTNETLDRNALAKEFEQLKREINDIAEQTTFNNMKILDGSLSYSGYVRSAATAGINSTVEDITNAPSASNITKTTVDGKEGSTGVREATGVVTIGATSEMQTLVYADSSKNTVGGTEINAADQMTFKFDLGIEGLGEITLDANDLVTGSVIAASQAAATTKDNSVGTALAAKLSDLQENGTTEQKAALANYDIAWTGTSLTLTEQSAHEGEGSIKANPQGSAVKTTNVSIDSTGKQGADTDGVVKFDFDGANTTELAKTGTTDVINTNTGEKYTLQFTEGTDVVGEITLDGEDGKTLGDLLDAWKTSENGGTITMTKSGQDSTFNAEIKADGTLNLHQIGGEPASNLNGLTLKINLKTESQSSPISGSVAPGAKEIQAKDAEAASKTFSIKLPSVEKPEKPEALSSTATDAEKAAYNAKMEQYNADIAAYNKDQDESLKDGATLKIDGQTYTFKAPKTDEKTGTTVSTAVKANKEFGSLDELKTLINENKKTSSDSSKTGLVEASVAGDKLTLTALKKEGTGPATDLSDVEKQEELKKGNFTEFEDISKVDVEVGTPEGAGKKTTVEFDFAKIQDGDAVKITIGGKDITVEKKTGDTRQSFMDRIGKTLESDIKDDRVQVKGNALIATGVDVKVESKLEKDALTNVKDTNAVRIQVGALENEQLSISIDAMNTAGLGLDDAHLMSENNPQGALTLDQDAAGAAITATRNAINKVSDQRATLGAMQNRLDHKIANLKVSSENLSAAESRIRDVDMASEMTEFTKNNILSQAATAMLAQANSLPQNVLSLLG